MSKQTTHAVSDLDRDYALTLFTSLTPEQQREIIALAAAVSASPR